MSIEQEQFLDVPAIRAQARAEWEQKIRKSISIPEKIDESVPWWLIVVAAVFFLLSIPHTMTVFERATPMLGYVAPAGIEFGLLYAAFRRRQTGRMPWFLRILEVLLFFTAIVANGVGSFDAIVSRGDVVRDLSFAEMITAFPTLPATSQAALLLSPLMALIIPVGTVAVGEGLAHLVMDRRRRGNPLEERWREVASQVEFEALRDAALMSGMTPGRAVRWVDILPESHGRGIITSPRQNASALRQQPEARSQPNKEAKLMDNLPHHLLRGKDVYYVYVIEQDVTNLHKIGMTKNPRKRITDLMIGSPYGLDYLYIWPMACRRDAENVEAILHMKFRNSCIGGEWFNLDKSERDWLMDMELIARCVMEATIAEVKRRKWRPRVTSNRVFLLRHEPDVMALYLADKQGLRRGPGALLVGPHTGG